MRISVAHERIGLVLTLENLQAVNMIYTMIDTYQQNKLITVTVEIPCYMLVSGIWSLFAEWFFVLNFLLFPTSRTTVGFYVADLHAFWILVMYLYSSIWTQGTSIHSKLKKVKNISGLFSELTLGIRKLAHWRYCLTSWSCTRAKAF